MSYNDHRHLPLIPTNAVVKYRIHGNNKSVLHDVVRARGWIESDHEGDWHFLWTDTAWVRTHTDKTSGALLPSAFLPSSDVSTAAGGVGVGRANALNLNHGASFLGESIRYPGRAAPMPPQQSQQHGHFSATGGESYQSSHPFRPGSSSSATSYSATATGMAPSFRHVNHFRGSEALSRLDLAVKHFKRIEKLLAEAGDGFEEELEQFNFYLPTFAVPADWASFDKAFRSPDRVRVPRVALAEAAALLRAPSMNTYRKSVCAGTCAGSANGVGGGGEGKFGGSGVGPLVGTSAASSPPLLVPTTSNPLHPNVWILKPPQSERLLGKAPFLFSKISTIAEWKRDFKFKEAQQALILAAAKEAAAAAAAAASPATSRSSTSAGGLNQSATTNGGALTSGSAYPHAQEGGSKRERRADHADGGEDEPTAPHIVQRYIESPHLIGGKKYDLCVYVLVSDFSSPKPRGFTPRRLEDVAASTSFQQQDKIDNLIATQTGTTRLKPLPLLLPEEKEGTAVSSSNHSHPNYPNYIDVANYGGSKGYSPYGGRGTTEGTSNGVGDGGVAGVRGPDEEGPVEEQVAEGEGLTIWIYRSGFARFCRQRFTMQTGDLGDTACHLITNQPSQKTNPRYSPLIGCKWSLRSLRQYLCGAVGEDVTHELFESIQRAVVRAVQCVHRSVPTSGVPHRARSELFAVNFVIQHMIACYPSPSSSGGGGGGGGPNDAASPRDLPRLFPQGDVPSPKLMSVNGSSMTSSPLITTTTTTTTGKDALDHQRSAVGALTMRGRDWEDDEAVATAQQTRQPPVSASVSSSAAVAPSSGGQRPRHVLRPVIVSIDSNPPCTADTLSEYHLRYNLLKDYLDVIDLECERDQDEIRVGGFDLVWRHGPVGISLNDTAATSFRSFIGCGNELAIPMSKLPVPPKIWGGEGERTLI